jgi:transcriptional regulator with XRE-family HTH domain
MDGAIRDLVDDLRRSRIAMGRTQAWVARAIGVSPALVGRLERNELRDTSAGHVAAYAAVLGLAVRVSAFPEGEPVRDAVQLRLVGALRERMHASLVWRTEVALPIPGDRRAWDAVAIGGDAWTAFEGISRLGVVDATLRRVNQKHRDDPRIGRVVLVLADTVRNRRTLADAAFTIRSDYPLDTRTVLGALASGKAPALNGVVILRIPRRDAVHPQPVHTRGILVDDLPPGTPKLVDNRVGVGARGP